MRHRLCTLAIVLLAMSASVFAQTPIRPVNAFSGADNSAGNEQQVIRVGTTLVNLPVVAKSKKRTAFTPRLQAQDFVLYEDGVKQDISFFSNESEPFNIILLLETGFTTATELEKVKESAIKFINGVRPGDKIKLVSYAETTTAHTDFINDRARLVEAVDGLQSGNGWKLYDAVYGAAQDFRQVNGRKALVLITSGEADGDIAPEEAIEEIAESGATVYALRYSFGYYFNPFSYSAPYSNQSNGCPNYHRPIESPRYTPPPPPRGGGGKCNEPPPQIFLNIGTNSARSFIKELVEATRGVYIEKLVKDLPKATAAVAEELHHTYSIGYYPTNPVENGGRRKIKLEVKEEAKVSIRYLKKYNAQSFVKKVVGN